VYLEHFGLALAPFKPTPDPRFVFLTDQNREIIAKAQYLLDQRLGIGVVFGEVGVGKSSTARLIYQQLRDDPAHVVGSIANPSARSECQFVRSLCRAFGLKSARTMQGTVDALYDFFLANYEESRTTSLILDEAQVLAGRRALLEQLRLLTNFETDEDKLFNVLLFGQDELRTALLKPRMRAFKSRVAIQATLDPLSHEDTIAMIRFRLTVAGTDRELFTPEAYLSIHKHSRGVPRSICVIADNALIRAFARNAERVQVDMVEQSAAELVL